jgi:hypothetical protein
VERFEQSSIELRPQTVLSRLDGIIDAELVKRKSGKLVLTAIGRVFNKARKTIEMEKKWKHRVMDSV